MTLTHSSLSIPFENVIWFYVTFEDKLRTIHAFPKYLKESCRLCSGKQFYFECFQIMLLKEIRHGKCLVFFGHYRHEWVKKVKYISDLPLYNKAIIGFQ